MIAQQMQITRGGYVVPLVKNCGHPYPFMDGYTRYNQIKMAPEDEKYIAFCTPIDIYCYKVMPYGHALKLNPLKCTFMVSSSKF
jgi:hypothetical protein